ncbi:type II toxin-antitoxin system VapC family toxin [Viscerimonas tarda]
MKYYLDTNIIIFLMSNKEHDDIDINVSLILNDYENVFYVSATVVRELLQLYKDGELKSIKYKSYKELFSYLDSLNIDIKPFNRGHLISYAELSSVDGHKDPNDHMIIAQAISDKIPLISSDRKFKEYTSQGLNFIFNKR